MAYRALEIVKYLFSLFVTQSSNAFHYIEITLAYVLGLLEYSYCLPSCTPTASRSLETLPQLPFMCTDFDIRITVLRPNNERMC